MAPYLYMVIAFILVVLIKAYINFSKLCSAKKLRKRYNDSLKREGNSFLEHIPQARALFADAGLSNATIPATQNIGYGQVVASNVKIVDNLDNRRVDIVSAVLVLFDELVGSYRLRLKESFSIRYWIETILFLPSRIMAYLGCNPDGIFAKVMQIIYWLATPLLIFFRSKINRFLIGIAKTF